MINESNSQDYEDKAKFDPEIFLVEHIFSSFGDTYEILMVLKTFLEKI